MADLIQWVNLDPADAALRDVPGVGVIPPERCGPTVTLRARVSGRRRRGRRVYWGVQLGPDNLAAVDPANASWTLRAGMGGFGAPGFYEKLVPTDRRGWSTTTFQLSEVGGDQFTIKAYIKRANGRIRRELKSDTITVWRQIYYQLTTMGPSAGNRNLPAVPDIDWAGLTAEYDDSRKKHNMRWTRISSGPITRHLSLWSDDMIKRTGLEQYDRTREPLLLKVSLVDMIAEKAQEDHTFDVVKANRTYTHTFGSVLFDLNSADDRTDWFRSCSGHGVDRPGDAVPVTRDDFAKTGPATITVTLASVPRTFFRPLCPRATVNVSVNLFDGGTLGLSWYNGIWSIHRLPTWNAAGQPVVEEMDADEKVATMVHEFGHAIGMVPTASPFHYPTSHGHQGPHCWNGATDPSTFPAADRYTSPTGAVCTMFGDNSSNTEEYCDTCSDFVRSRRPAVDGKFRANRMMPANIAAW